MLPRQGWTAKTDADGVLKWRDPHNPASDKLWDHPVAQAQYALMALNSYRRTQDAIYLTHATANAQRLIDTRVEHAGAWFFPYGFDWSFWGTTVYGPWYSARAQGQALSAFVRLFEATGDIAWRNAADHAFQSLLNAPVANQPFASWVDPQRNLWLEEYPQPNIVSSEKVLNGHVFAAFGLHDYWRLTRDPRAAQLYDGAVTTVQNTDLAVFRNRNWASFYSIRHMQVNTNYHQVHIQELLDLYQQTRRPHFVAAAFAYRSDYPMTGVTGSLRVTRKLHKLHRLKPGGIIDKTRKVTFKRPRTFKAVARQRVKGGPVMLKIGSGKWKGWWVREQYGKAWMTTPTDEHVYQPFRAMIGFKPGTYVGYRYSASGRRLATRKVRVPKATMAPTVRSAIVGGQSAYEFTPGTWKGYWVPMQAGMLVG